MTIPNRKLKVEDLRCALERLRLLEQDLELSFALRLKLDRVVCIVIDRVGVGDVEITRAELLMRL